MTNMEVWLELCGGLGVDPRGLSMRDLAKHYLLHPSKSGDTAADGESLGIWLGDAMEWHAQPQGYDFWSGVCLTIGNGVHIQSDGGQAVRLAGRACRAAKL
jgi:hypothetical protein